MTSARPVQAALTSALTFSVGAALYGGRIAHQYNCPSSVCRVFGLPRASRGNRSEGGRRGRSPRHRPSDLLGRVGDGSEHRYWEGFRNDCLARQGARTQFITLGSKICPLLPMCLPRHFLGSICLAKQLILLPVRTKLRTPM